MNPTLQGSTFDQWVDRYLRRQRSLGRAYVHEEHVIGALRRFLEEEQLYRPRSSDLRGVVRVTKSSLCKHAAQSPAYRAQLLPLSSAHRAHLLRPRH